MADASTGDKAIMEKEQIHARLPPELLVHIDLSTNILKSFYLLPSVMHRLETLMLASQLRKEIGYNDNLIPSSLVCVCNYLFFVSIIQYHRLFLVLFRFWKQ